MALSAPYNQYKYLNRFGANRHTIEYLVSALYQKGVSLNQNTPIPLPKIDGVIEQIPAYLAFNFVIEWASDNNYLTSKEIDFFNKNIFKSPNSVLTRLFTALQKRVIEPEHLLTDRLVANVAALEQAQKLQAVTPTQKFDPIAVIKQYNQEKLSLHNIIATQTGRLKNLVPQKLTADTNGDITTQSVVDLIGDDFETLSYTYATAAAKYQDIQNNHERAVLVGQALHARLTEVIKTKKPSHLAFVAQSYNEQDFTNLAMIIGVTIETYTNEGGDLARLTSLKTQTSQAIPLLLPSQNDIYAQITQIINSKDGHKLAEEVIRELSRSAGEGISAQDLLKKVGQKAGLNDSQINDLILKLADTPTLAAIDYQLSQYNLIHQQLGVSPIDIELKRRGINPTLIPYDLEEELKKQGISASRQKDKTKKYQENEQAIKAKLNEAKEAGNIRDIENLTQLLTQNLYDYIANTSEKGLAKLSKTNHQLNALRAKIEEAERAFFDKWFEFEEKLPWNVAARKVFAKIEELQTLVNEAIYKIEAKLKLPQIPLFGLTNFLFDKWHQLKINQTNKVFRWVSTWQSGRPRQIAKWVIRQYRYGNYTLSGAFSSGIRSGLSSAYKWTLTKITSSAVWKKASEWGGKAFGGALKVIATKLGALGGKLVAAAISAATVIGLVFTVIGIVSAVIDFVIKPIVTLFKKIFSDPAFAAVSIWLAGTLATLASLPALISSGLALALAGLAAAFGSLAALFSTSLLWAVGTILTLNILYFSGISLAPKLAPGNPQSSLANENTNTLKEDSPYIEVTKEVFGSFIGDKKISNSHINQTLKYKVTVTALDTALNNIKIKDVASLTNKDGSRPVGDPQDEVVTSLLPGESYSFEYTLKLNADFRDSYLNNSVTVTADSDSGPQTEITGQSIIIGTPPVLPAGLFAVRLAEAISQCYGSVVTISDNGTCLSNLKDPQITPQIISILVASANKYTYLQCVGFIQAVMQGVHGSYPSAGDAGDYIITPPAGYTLFKGTPMPGDLFVQGYDIVSGTGHIGVVVRVDGNIVTVADANSNGKGIARSNAKIPLDRISGFLRKK